MVSTLGFIYKNKLKTYHEYEDKLIVAGKKYVKDNNRQLINGNYWALNSYSFDKGSSIQYGFDFFILEDLTKKIDVRPVMVLKK